MHYQYYQQQKRIDRKKIFWLFIFLLDVAVIICLLLINEWRQYNPNNRVSAQGSTDLCQYPTRPLINGECDNSDPCDPTLIRFNGGQCITNVKGESDTKAVPMQGK